MSPNRNASANDVRPRATHRVAHHLSWVRVHLVVCIFLFWVLQMIAWIGMVIYIQFFDPKLGSNVLYVTQISHWALVLACGTAATATWGVITTRTHAKQLEQDEQERRDGQGACK